MGTIKATNIEPIADNGTVTLGSSGDTLTVPSGVTVAGAMANTPAFYAYKSSGQSVSQNTYVKVTFETELFDSDGKFADSRFTPTVAGYYLISSTVSFTNHPAGAYCLIAPYKNGSAEFVEINTNQSSGDADTKTTATFMIYLDSDDYLEIFIRHNAGQSETTRSGNEVRFMAQRVIGV